MKTSRDSNRLQFVSRIQSFLVFRTQKNKSPLRTLSNLSNANKFPLGKPLLLVFESKSKILTRFRSSVSGLELFAEYDCIATEFFRFHIDIVGVKPVTTPREIFFSQANPASCIFHKFATIIAL